MRRYTLKFQIVLLFFLISLPALALSLAASRVNMKEAQEQVVNVKQNSMKMLVKQYDTSLEAIENYIQLILMRIILILRFVLTKRIPGISRQGSGSGTNWIIC